MLVVLLGGARARKSSLACGLASDRGKPVTFIATAEVRDKEFARQIGQHRYERLDEWNTVEAPTEVTAARSEVAEEETAILECGTLRVANLLEQGLCEDEVVVFASALARRTPMRPRLVVTVSNGKGSGIVAGRVLARHVRDVLGRVHAAVSLRADHAFLVVAGRALPLVHPSLIRTEASSW